MGLLLKLHHRRLARGRRPRPRHALCADPVWGLARVSHGRLITTAFTREQLCQDRRMADESVADRLRGFGVKGILVQMAERGQILELKCEMPQCYHPNGRDKFE